MEDKLEIIYQVFLFYLMMILFNAIYLSIKLHISLMLLQTIAIILYSLT